jgi:aspartyl-tRNA(Asn)/glutamyl-tRNA(Gln) amidotransferase subunit B
MSWEAVIGLEIHVQLKTRTKMFCRCAVGALDAPNTRTCPICLAHPGTLPVPNRQAVEWTIRLGLALGCEIAEHAVFHRKHYFYPDNPKGYQISQYDEPLCIDGLVRLPGPDGVAEIGITRAHLEEDAAKTLHVGGAEGRIHGATASLVDFNRGGTPLVEIVTEPDLRSASEAAEWARLLRETVRQLGVSDVNMEEGSLRVDGNISVRPLGSEQLGTKTELKNMNSFRFLERGIEAELARQRELIEAGGTVEQETLHFHPGDGTLTPLRSKEEAHDYRYFPEPDLVPLAPTEEMLREARESLPELPAARIERYEGMGLAGDAAALLATDPETAGYFEQVAAEAADIEPRVVANWVTGELAAALRQDGGGASAAESRVEPQALAALVLLVQEKKISHGSGKTVLAAIVAEGGDPAPIVEREGLAQISDSGELEAIVAAAVEANPEAAEQIRSGNQKAIGAIVGAVMKETKGRADGGEVNRLIKEKLGT